MTQTVCDRCGAPATATQVETSRRTIVLPTEDPSTSPVTADCEVSLGVTVSPQDLCPICQVSALVEYALARASTALTPTVLGALSVRINAVTGFKP